jgi:uncharacterized protein YndB with AHSA1/START domain
MIKRALATSMALLLPLAAVAEVKQSADDGAFIEQRFQVSASPDVAWSALTHPERWWPSDHTWSGNATNMRLRAEAGACFCENWGENSVEHGRVIMAVPGKLLRISGALGPLQEMAVTGVLSIQLAAKDGGTEATVTYRLSGDVSQKLDAFISVVDKVVGQQFGSFASYASNPATKPAP